jgi:hypothetical protein
MADGSFGKFHERPEDFSTEDPIGVLAGLAGGDERTEHSSPAWRSKSSFELVWELAH